jgi:hypothetical protein
MISRPGHRRTKVYETSPNPIAAGGNDKRSKQPGATRHFHLNEADQEQGGDLKK